MSRSARPKSPRATRGSTRSLDAPRPLWICPRCGARLVTRNLSHSCGLATMAEWKQRMGPRARALYRRFEAMIARCGPFHTAPAKTRIAFLARVRFASVTALSERRMICAFAMPGPLRSRRFTKVEEIVPGWWGHSLRITEVDQLDAELQAWLRQSYRLMGLQQRLTRRGARHRGRSRRPSTSRRRPRIPPT